MVKEIVTKPANTAQPFQQEKEVATKQVVTDKAAVINPWESESYCQAQFKERGVTTDPESDEDGAKKSTKDKRDT